MPDPDLEARVSALEMRMNEVAADASAARHLAAADVRDYADLSIKVDANRKAINALGVQTADRFDRLEQKMDRGFAKVDEDFATVRAVLLLKADLRSTAARFGSALDAAA
jgi:hypothetical protein